MADGLSQRERDAQDLITYLQAQKLHRVRLLSLLCQLVWSFSLSASGSRQPLPHIKPLEGLLGSCWLCVLLFVEHTLIVHSLQELVLRYNPTSTMTQEERTRATARTVGLDVPIEHIPDKA
jgi:hypothetical protein